MTTNDFVSLTRLLRAAAEQAGDMLLLKSAADKIEELQRELHEARKDAARLLVASADLDGFLFDAMTKADYIDQVAAERGHETPTHDDELEAVRRMIDYQMSALPPEH